VIFTFDPDEAGQKAASRAFAEEQRFAAQTFVAVAPDGLDPCDLRLNKGDDAVRRLIKSRKPMFEFMVRRRLAEHDLETVEGRVAALRAAAPVVAGIRDQALSVGYVRNLAGWLGMDPGEVQRAVQAARASVSRAPEPDRSHEDEQPRREDQPDLMKLPTDPATRLERDALMAVLQHPAEIGEDMIRRVSQVAFADNTLAVVRDAIATSLDRWNSPGWLSAVADEVPATFSTLVKQLGVAPIPEREDRIAVYCRSVTADIVDRDLLRQKRDLLGAMQRLDAASEPEKYAQVQRDLVRVETERRALRTD
jgi:DNA primase